MPKRMIGIAVSVVFLVSCLWIVGRLPAEEEKGAEEMLEEVLKNQEKMMADLRVIREELNRIRIRTN